MPSTVGGVREDTNGMRPVVNDIIKRSLSAVHVPSRLEPTEETGWCDTGPMEIWLFAGLGCYLP